MNNSQIYNLLCYFEVFKMLVFVVFSILFLKKITNTFFNLLNVLSCSEIAVYLLANNFKIAKFFTKDKLHLYKFRLLEIVFSKSFFHI